MTNPPQHGPGEYGRSTRPPMPTQVNLASAGLFALAALQLLSAIVLFASRQTFVEAIRERQPGAPQQAVEFAATVGSIGGAIFSIILAGLYLWLGIMTRKGRNWARITATVILAIGIIGGLFGLTREGLAINTVVGVVALIVSIAVVVLLYLRPSNAYFSSGAPA